MLTAEIDLVLEMGCSVSVAYRTWSVISLRWRAPTTMHTYTNTIFALYPELKTDRDAKEFRLGMRALYGTRPWYPKSPPITLSQVLKAIRLAPEWLAVRLDLTWNAMGRDGDLRYLLCQDVSLDHLTQTATIDFSFLKNDQDGANGTIKVIHPFRFRSLARYMRRFQPDAPLFPEEYSTVLPALRRLFGPNFGTRLVRRGSATHATMHDVEPEAIQQMLAHRSLEQQRTYTGLLNVRARRQQNQVALALRTPISRKSRLGDRQLTAPPTAPKRMRPCPTSTGVVRVTTTKFPVQPRSLQKRKAVTISLSKAPDNTPPSPPVKPPTPQPAVEWAAAMAAAAVTWDDDDVS